MLVWIGPFVRQTTNGSTSVICRYLPDCVMMKLKSGLSWGTQLSHSTQCLSPLCLLHIILSWGQILNTQLMSYKISGMHKKIKKRKEKTIQIINTNRHRNKMQQTKPSLMLCICKRKTGTALQLKEICCGQVFNLDWCNGICAIDLVTWQMFDCTSEHITLYNYVQLYK